MKEGFVIFYSLICAILAVSAIPSVIEGGYTWYIITVCICVTRIPILIIVKNKDLLWLDVLWGSMSLFLWFFLLIKFSWEFLLALVLNLHFIAGSLLVFVVYCYRPEPIYIPVPT